MDMIHSETPSNPFSLRIQLDELYSNPLIDQFFSVLLRSIGGKDFLVLVIGESQSGKTTFLSKLVSKFEQDIKPCQLKIRENEDPSSRNNNYPAFLYKTEHNQVIILDDAHDLNSQELSIILKNAWDNNKKTSQLILFCEPKINTIISSLLKKMPKKTSVNKLYMPSFDQKQTESYIKHYLEVANFSKKSPFPGKNIKNIFKKSKGLPGKINYEAHKIFSGKNSLLSDTKQSKLKFNQTTTFAIAILIFFIIGGFFILKKTSLSSVPDSNVKVSELQHKTITKKIKPFISTEKIDKTDPGDQVDQPKLTQKSKKDQITKAILAQSKITETDISKTDTNNPNIHIDTNEILSKKQISKPETIVAKIQTTRPSAIDNINKEKKPKTPIHHSLFQEKWIMTQKPQKYTIQILAAKEEDAINRFIKLNINIHNEIAYYKMYSNGGVWYKFISGNFETLEQARTACINLPAKLKNLGPWPRQFSSIHNDINKFIKLNSTK